jgi:hypothetical protein
MDFKNHFNFKTFISVEVSNFVKFQDFDGMGIANATLAKFNKFIKLLLNS